MRTPDWPANTLGAITRQLDQMEIARAKASDAGCGFARPGAEAGECVALHGAIERMARNLGTLERQRSLISGDRKQPNAKLLAALEANGCRDEAAAERPKSETENDEKAVLTAPEAVEPLAEPIEPEITIIGIEVEFRSKQPTSDTAVADARCSRAR